MLKPWPILLVFIVGYFLGWRRGEYVGTVVAFKKATEEANKAIREFKLKYLKGEENGKNG